MIRRSFLIALLLPSAVFSYGTGTEKYIPIGQSPGISNVKSVQGIIKSTTANSITIQATTGGLVVVEFDKSTNIWIDRSQLKLPNKEGTLADLLAESYIEIYSPKWIKIKGLK